METLREDEAKKTCIGYAALFAAVGALALSVFGTGCAGMEVGGKVGVYRVDERQESQRTYRNAVPLKCYFVQCDPSGHPESQGS